MPAPKFPRTTCKVPQACALCPQRIRAGMVMAKDFTSNEWVHVGCLIRKINQPSTEQP